MTFTKDHFNLAERILYRLSRRWLSDKKYAEWNLRRWLGGGNIDQPTTFNEKLQWLKLYNRDPAYQEMVDKYAVREFVTARIGQRYVNQVYGVYDSSHQIVFSDLPDSFVLKATHGSGMNILVKEKKDIEIEKACLKLDSWLGQKYENYGREWVYKNARPRIVAERMLMDSAGEPPNDYKIFCFHGVPHYIQVDLDRYTNHTRAFFDTNWEKQDFEILYDGTTKAVGRPTKLEEMLLCARALSAGIPFVRVDFYAIPEVIFGEMTFYPGNGYEPFRPVEWDKKLGLHLNLNTNI